MYLDHTILQQVCSILIFSHDYLDVAYELQRTHAITIPRRLVERASNKAVRIYALPNNLSFFNSSPSSIASVTLEGHYLISNTFVPLAGIPQASQEPIPFPSLRVESAPPDYSWEWGGFPQRSPVGTQYPVPTPLQTLDGALADDLATDSKVDDFHRSQSLHPEFGLEFSDEPPSTLPPEADQLHQLESLSDVETEYGHGPSSPSQEYRSWVRWWRRDRRLPSGVDIRVERPPLKTAATIPLPSVSCIL